MIRLSTVIWLFLVAVSGYAMFQVKYQVTRLEDEARDLNRSINQTREAIHVLDADWSFLNQPARLDQLAKRHLVTLGPIGAKQIGRLDTLPPRSAETRGPGLATPPIEPYPASPGPAPHSPAAGTKLAAAAKPRTE